MSTKPYSPKRTAIKCFLAKLNSPYLFFDNKLLVSVDFGICKLMERRPDGKLNSEVCPGCYASRMLSVTLYSPLRQKLERADAAPEIDLERFETDLKALEAFFEEFGQPLHFLRFYSFSDFMGKPNELEAIRLAASYFRVVILTKTLHSHHRDDLVSLFYAPNVWLSLSFNSNFDASHIKLIQLLIEGHVALRAQLNWTFLSGEPYVDKGIFQVYHTVRRDRDRLGEVVGDHLVCGVKDEEAQPALKGVCDRCGFCYRSYFSHQKKRLLAEARSAS